jgi:hypothetical protein
MGFIHENDLRDQFQSDGLALPSHPMDRDGFRCFQLAELAPKASTPSGMKEEVVLLAWLVVLMRTREGTLPRFEWAYKSRAEDASVKSVNYELPTETLVPGLDSSVEQIATAISQHIKAVTPVELGAAPNSMSLILSSGSLTYDAEANEEVSIRLNDDDGVMETD